MRPGAPRAHGGSRLAGLLARRPVRVAPTRRLVSFTFDGITARAAASGGGVLDAHDVRGTFYTAPGTWGRTRAGVAMASADDVDALHRAGHEIGCHTFDGVPVDGLRPAELARQVALSAEAFRGGAADRRFSSFSYPGGAVTVPAKRQLARRFASLRGSAPGVNTGMADLALLRSVALGDPTTGRTPEQWLDLAQTGGWLVFHCPDVDGGASGGGATSEQLDRTVTRARDLGFEVLPVRHAIGRLQGA